MKATLRVVVATLLPLAASALTGCSPSPPDVVLLASDVHFRIAGQHIVIPAVAMRQPDHVFNIGGARSGNSKEELQKKASDTAEPMDMERSTS